MLHLARDDKERASSIDEQRIDGALGIALFFSPFLSASSDPFVRNFFVCTEPLAESNPVPQDPISAIHPPCIYAGDVASAMGFGLCRSKMMNGIVALHSPPMRKDAAEKNGTLFRSVGCPAYAASAALFRPLSLWTGALVDTGREQAKRVVRNGKKDTTTSPLCWTAGANTVVSDQDQEPIRIWILTCRWNLFNTMKQQASVRRTYKKEMVVARSTLVHLRHSARAQKGRKERTPKELLPASAAVAAKLTEEGGGEGWRTSNGLELSQNWKRFDSSLMLLSQERKAHARNES
ncbi:hypothetical protein RND71_008074 [Anisodus tanguticus]|uniref:Cytochrome c assembly protein domain-containing protein n=1 Tax=Anisodus tanguticus TaxID=243964 RepID=A0AAE1SMJ8_9SOLA|nr:hypothetical protein RND71_008074 [Anisodus tanguticus]